MGVDGHAVAKSGHDGQGPPGMAWPVATLDFEASSLTRQGYPIEVGVATWTDPEASIRSWSTLIQPTSEWWKDGHWDPRSARVHGIARGELAAGLPPRDVGKALNALLRGLDVVCDGHTAATREELR